jgi:hypothetical protein
MIHNSKRKKQVILARLSVLAHLLLNGQFIAIRRRVA